jgi:predicted phosphodiesterase
MTNLERMLDLKARGLKNKQIASELGVTKNTVIGALWRHEQVMKAVDTPKPQLTVLPPPDKVPSVEEWGGEKAEPQVREFRDALKKLERDKRYVVVEHDHDNHFPYHDPNAQAMRSKARQAVQPDLIVGGSDAGDFPTISRFEADRRISNVRPLSHFRDFWWPHVSQMVYDAPKALRVWIDGNHDERVWLNIEAGVDPDVRTSYHAETIQANKHVYWLGTGDESLEVLVGNALVVTHGTRANVHTAAATLNAYDNQYSVLAGHSHRPDYFTRGTKYKVSASIGGCGCLLKPHYDRRNLHSHWQHSYQYAVVDTLTETAVVNLVEFYHTSESIWCYVNGQVMTVKKEQQAGQAAA